MLPAFIVVSLGFDAAAALIISQVVLSLALPAPIIALVLFTRRFDIMGRFASGALLQAAAVTGACIVLLLNSWLVFQILGAGF